MNSHIIFIFIVILFISLSKKKAALFLCFALVLWLFSFRTNEIPDTEVYHWMYDDPISRLGHNEFGFLLIGYIFKTITNADFIVYYLALVGICLFLWYYGSRKLLDGNEHWGMLFLIFISFFGFLYMGVLIRNCISELLVFSGLVFLINERGKKSHILYIMFVLIATSIHKSSIIFLLLIPLLRIKISTLPFIAFL